MTEQRPPRSVKPEDIERHIVKEYYFTAAQGVIGVIGVSAEVAAGEAEQGVERPVQLVEMHNRLRLVTLCVLVLGNGYTLVGSSACADEAGFDAETGKKIARQDAFAKAWPIFGFLLVNQMALEANVAEIAQTAQAQAESLQAQATGQVQ